jgi:hypothetical protein
MAANPSGAHQAGELSLAKHRWISSGGVRACRANETSAGTPTPQLQFFEWTVALAEQRSPISKGLQYQQSFALKFAFILLNSQIGTMTAQGDVARAAKPNILQVTYLGFRRAS